MTEEEYKLTSERVEAIIRNCLYIDEEVPAMPDTLHRKPYPADAVHVDGIINPFVFHPGRLQSHAEEIKAMLLQLPDPFMHSKGGGWSFLNACEDNTGHQWTGMHQVMEWLFVLGQGIGAVKCQLPRETWGALPGGMPYYVVMDDE